jgi:hypothetical protein
MPPCHARARQPPGMHQHLVEADRIVVEEAVKPAALAAVLRQCVHAHRPLPQHRRKQLPANARQPRVAEFAQLHLLHANRPHTRTARHRIDSSTPRKVDSHLWDHGSPLREGVRGEGTAC